MTQRLGVDSYSLRSQGWDAFDFLEYSARIGLDNVHFSERRNLESLDRAYLERLKRRADELGLALEIGLGSFDKHAQSFRADLGSGEQQLAEYVEDRKSTRLNSSHVAISYAVFCLKKKKK